MMKKSSKQSSSLKAPNSVSQYQHQLQTHQPSSAQLIVGVQQQSLAQMTSLKKKQAKNIAGSSTNSQSYNTTPFQKSSAEIAPPQVSSTSASNNNVRNSLNEVGTLQRQFNNQPKNTQTAAQKQNIEYFAGSEASQQQTALSQGGGNIGSKKGPKNVNSQISRSVQKASPATQTSNSHHKRVLSSTISSSKGAGSTLGHQVPTTVLAQSSNQQNPQASQKSKNAILPSQQTQFRIVGSPSQGIRTPGQGTMSSGQFSQGTLSHQATNSQSGQNTASATKHGQTSKQSNHLVSAASQANKVGLQSAQQPQNSTKMTQFTKIQSFGANKRPLIRGSSKKIPNQQSMQTFTTTQHPQNNSLSNKEFLLQSISKPYSSVTHTLNNINCAPPTTEQHQHSTAKKSSSQSLLKMKSQQMMLASSHEKASNNIGQTMHQQTHGSKNFSQIVKEGLKSVKINQTGSKTINGTEFGGNSSMKGEEIVSGKIEQSASGKAPNRKLIFHLKKDSRGKIKTASKHVGAAGTTSSSSTTHQNKLKAVNRHRRVQSHGDALSQIQSLEPRVLLGLTQTQAHHHQNEDQLLQYEYSQMQMMAAAENAKLEAHILEEEEDELGSNNRRSSSQEFDSKGGLEEISHKQQQAQPPNGSYSNNSIIPSNQQASSLHHQSKKDKLSAYTVVVSEAAKGAKGVKLRGDERSRVSENNSKSSNNQNANEGSREQISILSLNSLTRSTPKFQHYTLTQMAGASSNTTVQQNSQNVLQQQQSSHGNYNSTPAPSNQQVVRKKYSAENKISSATASQTRNGKLVATKKDMLVKSQKTAGLQKRSKEQKLSLPVEPKAPKTQKNQFEDQNVVDQIQMGSPEQQFFPKQKQMLGRVRETKDQQYLDQTNANRKTTIDQQFAQDQLNKAEYATNMHIKKAQVDLQRLKDMQQKIGTPPDVKSDKNRASRATLTLSDGTRHQISAMNQFYPHIDSNRKSTEQIDHQDGITGGKGDEDLEHYQSEGQDQFGEGKHFEKLPTPQRHILNLQKSKESNIVVADEKRSANGGIEADDEAMSIGIPVRESQTFKIGIVGGSSHKKSKSQAFANGFPSTHSPAAASNNEDLVNNLEAYQQQKKQLQLLQIQQQQSNKLHNIDDQDDDDVQSQKQINTKNEIANSATSAAPPGIYNMFMGQANQLKKTKIQMQHKVGSLTASEHHLAQMNNHSQRTHFIHLQTADQGGLTATTSSAINLASKHQTTNNLDNTSGAQQINHQHSTDQKQVGNQQVVQQEFGKQKKNFVGSLAGKNSTASIDTINKNSSVLSCGSINQKHQKLTSLATKSQNLTIGRRRQSHQNKNQQSKLSVGPLSFTSKVDSATLESVSGTHVVHRQKLIKNQPEQNAASKNYQQANNLSNKNATSTPSNPFQLLKSTTSAKLNEYSNVNSAAASAHNNQVNNQNHQQRRQPSSQHLVGTPKMRKTNKVPSQSSQNHHQVNQNGLLPSSGPQMSLTAAKPHPKNISFKHKQLAKAIKQHHQMVSGGGGGVNASSSQAQIVANNNLTSSKLHNKYGPNSLISATNSMTSLNRFSAITPSVQNTYHTKNVTSQNNHSNKNSAVQQTTTTPTQQHFTNSLTSPVLSKPTQSSNQFTSQQLQNDRDAVNSNQMQSNNSQVNLQLQSQNLNSHQRGEQLQTTNSVVQSIQKQGSVAVRGTLSPKQAKTKLLKHQSQQIQQPLLQTLVTQASFQALKDRQQNQNDLQQMQQESQLSHAQKLAKQRRARQARRSGLSGQEGMIHTHGISSGYNAWTQNSPPQKKTMMLGKTSEKVTNHNQPLSFQTQNISDENLQVDQNTIEANQEQNDVRSLTERLISDQGGVILTDREQQNLVNKAKYRTNEMILAGTDSANKNGTDNSSQQISAAIIKKIQNNYQFQVTNTAQSPYEMFDQIPCTECEKRQIREQACSKTLNSIERRISAANTPENRQSKPIYPFLQAIQEIGDVLPDNKALNSLVSSIYAGLQSQFALQESENKKTLQRLKEFQKGFKDKESELKSQTDHVKHLEMNEQETRRHVHSMTGQIDERDFKIEQLEAQILEHQKRARLAFKKQIASGNKSANVVDLVFDGNCSELEKQSEERRKVFAENEDLQGVIDELNEDMAYGKQRENKLMFFLYILKQMGYPISEVFEREIKDVPTSRFSKNFDDEYKVMHAQLWKERKQAKREQKLEEINGFGIDRDEILIENICKSDRLVPVGQAARQFSEVAMSSGKFCGDLATHDESNLNFYPLQIGPIQAPQKPDCVPHLDINKVLVIRKRRAKGLAVSHLCNKEDSFENQSQSSEESVDSRGRPKRCPKPRLHKRILDHYGIQTGARNILALEQRVVKERIQKIKEQLLNDNNNQAGEKGTTDPSRIVENYDSSLASMILAGKLEDEEQLRFTLKSSQSETLQSHRI